MSRCDLNNHGWTRMWFANAHRYCVLACAVMLGCLAIAAESISITATPRYPWNGKVDLKFTIDGTSGTKYDTSFTAKDVAGGTNLTMKSLYKSNGAAANVAKEQLLPGTYNWVWDATADLGEGTVLEKVVVEGKTQLPDSEAKKYMILDLGTGAISYLTSVPSGGWGSTYKSTKVALRYCEPGQFKMQGSRLVHISKPFYIGVFEMTEKQIAKICGRIYAYTYRDKSSEFASECACGCISYNTARGSSNGAKWPSSSAVDSSSVIGKIRAKTKLNFDLPTEAQWEYACRAGTTTSYNDGSNASSTLNALAWYGMSNANHIANVVGKKNANAWGLYDMHGNVRELVLDWYASIGTVEATDPKGPASGTKRVCRGGEFTSSASACTSSSRTSVAPNIGSAYDPDFTSDAVGQGFRLCLTLE